MTSTELIDRILALSTADDCMVIVEEASNVNVRWANNSTTTNGAATSRTLLITAIRDQRVGTVHRSYIDETRLEDLVREAEAACEYQEPADDYFELVGADGETGESQPASQSEQTQPTDWATPAPTTSVAVFSQLSQDLAAAFKKAQAEHQKLFGYAEHTRTTTWLANSRGLRRRHDQQKGHVEITAKTDDFSSSVWVGQATKDFTDLAVAQLMARLQQRLEWSKTKLELPAGQYDTLLEPSAVADLLIYYYWTSAARDAVEGRTVFSDPGGKTKLGQTLAPQDISLYSDPGEPGLEVPSFEIAGASSSYASIFDNGVEVSRTNWIENGTLGHLITPRYWAKRQNTLPTPYIDNLIMTTDNDTSLDELIKGVKRGLLVTCLWYIREVDPQRLLLTGLTRDGVFLIEDGEVKGAVNNFRFNMSPVEMLGHIAASGQSGPTLPREWGDFFTFAKTPPLVIKDFNMSSVSQAL